MHGNEMIWHLVQMTSQIPQPLGETSSSNPLLKPDMAHTWGVGHDIDRCITVLYGHGLAVIFYGK